MLFNFINNLLLAKSGFGERLRDFGFWILDFGLLGKSNNLFLPGIIQAFAKIFCPPSSNPIRSVLIAERRPENVLAKNTKNN
jgi:hypothetical protein